MYWWWPAPSKTDSIFVSCTVLLTLS
jgi:hypothetical protein